MHIEDNKTIDEFDDIFQSGEPEEPAEETDKETSDEQPTNDDSAADNDSDDSASEETDDSDKEIDVEAILAERNKFEKRLKDTQKYAHRQKSKADTVLKKLLDEGTITEERYNELNTQEAVLDDDVLKQNLVDIEKQTRADLDVVAEALGDESVKEHYENFVKITQYDARFTQELMELPAAKRLSYMLDAGKEAREVLGIISEHDGNIIEAIKAGTTKDGLEAAEAKGYKKAKEEFEKKYKDYSSNKRPKLRGTNSESSKTTKENKEIDMEDIDFM